MRRYPNAGQRIDSKERRARDGSWASCPDNRAHDGNRAAAQPVRCRVRKQKAADWLYRCARGPGAAVGLCSSSAFRRYQNLGLHHRGHRSKEGQCFGAHDLVRGAVCGHYRAAGRYGNASRRAARAAFRQPWYRACRAIPREISADYFVVGWPGHLNPVCVGALCGVARHSRALEHERCPAPCGDARAGGCRDRHGARARERMGVAEGR